MFLSRQSLRLRILTVCAVLTTAGAAVAADQSATVKATLAPSTPESFTCVTEGRFYLQFRVACSPAKAVRAGDHIRFTFRDLFTGKNAASCERAIEKPADKVTIAITPRDVELKPSSYHVRLDLVREGAVLSTAAPGCCRVYVAREGESAHHMLGSFWVSRVAYKWNPKRKVYYRAIPTLLPESGDPFDPAARATYEEGLRAGLTRIKYKDWVGKHPMEVYVAESQADAGGGFLGAARAFRTIGEIDRARFCEEVLRRTIALSLKHMTTKKDGKVRGRGWGPRQQDCLLLKVFCDSCLYFRDVAGDKAYAQKLFDQLRPVAEHQFPQPNPLGCSQGKVYDGRVLGGLATYCLTERAMTGKLNDAHVATVLDFAARASKHVQAEKGWYATGTGECHTGYGNMNILSGLLISRRVALATGKEQLAAELKDSIELAFDFMARTHGAVTGHINWLPTRHGGWCQGFTYEFIDEMIGLFGEKKAEPKPWSLCYKNPATTIKRLVWYRAHLWRPQYNYYYHSPYSSRGSDNVLGIMLPTCDEYKRAVESSAAEEKKQAAKAAAPVKVVVLGDDVALGTSAKLDVRYPCLGYNTDQVNLVRDSQTWRSILRRILADWIDGGVELTVVATAGDTAATSALSSLGMGMPLSACPTVPMGYEGVNVNIRPTRLGLWGRGGEKGEWGVSRVAGDALEAGRANRPSRSPNTNGSGRA